MVLTILLEYKTKRKKLTGQMPFRLVYGKEAIIPMEFIMPRLHVVEINDILESNVVEEILSQLVQLDEHHFIAGFHKQVQKEREKEWQDRHIKQFFFQVGDLVLLHDSKFMQHPGKFCMHWLGPYVIQHVIKAGVVQLETLNGDAMGGMVNVSRLKLYIDGRPSVH
jgi:hypothetical protein